MNDPYTVYFDNGATSFPKPKVMYQAMLESMYHRGGNPGRSGHSLSIAAAQEVYQLRETAANFFGCDKPEHVVIAFNTTHALNMAIKSVIGRGDTVIYSDMEHNSVLRPINSLAATAGVTGKCFKTHFNEDDTLSSFKSICRNFKPKAVVCTHASNICQRRLPIEKMGVFCQQNNIFFIVDGAQSAGHEKMHFDKYGIDALCLPGHKGLYGPMGTGLLIASNKFAQYIKKRPTLIDGGSGIDSVSSFMPEDLPERLEAGTMPAPLLSGLRASIAFIESIGIDSIKEKETHIYRRLMDILCANKKVTVYMPEYRQGNVISFNVNGIPPAVCAEQFDKSGIFMRSGIHCSPLAHKTLGTLNSGGTVRISIGIFNTEKDADLFYKALKDITSL